MMTHRERFFAALNGEPTDRVPLFPLLMFLAADRAGISYRQFATDGLALAEAQLLMQERYGLDAITSCSDAFRVSADLGGDMVFPEDKPPYLRRALMTAPSEVGRLRRPDPLARGCRMGDRIRATSTMARAVSRQVAVLGWIDMPLAEACSVYGVSEFMMLLMDDPMGAHGILEFLTEIVIDFALAQVDAGDAVASLVSAVTYEEFALPYERRVCEAIHDAGGLIKLHICGDTAHLLAKTVESGADLFNVDHMVPLVSARDAYSVHGKCFKGNLDPVAQVMQAGAEQCEALAHECMDVARGTKYMLSAGCEIPAETPDEVFRAFCAAPGTYRPSMSCLGRRPQGLSVAAQKERP